LGVHSVVETPTFVAQVKRAGLTEAELMEIVATLATNPEAGGGD
jgi:alkylhydroperoxidase/carboxymuconolactone decarboxylase family protein YurZ